MSKANKAAETFIERMGLDFEADGGPRIAGRMLGFFIIYGGPFSFSQLTERLQVSRGSISTNARLLRNLGVIERVSLPGDRQDYYQLADSPYDRMLAGYIERMQRTVGNIEQAQANLPDDQQDAQDRLSEMRRFYQTAMATTEALIERMRRDGA